MSVDQQRRTPQRRRRVTGLKRDALALGLVAIIPIVAPGEPRAEALAQAIGLAYETNPTLQEQRAQLRALDETLIQARAGWEPSLSATATANHGEGPQAGVFGGQSETVSETGQATINANFPVYTGGRVSAQVSAAEAQIHAGREQLRTTESSVLLNVVQAFEDVVRDRAILRVQTESLAILQDEVDEIRARFEAGANTKTDVAQAEAQLDAARALVTSAQAQAEVSVAEYVSAVGQSPGTLESPTTLAGLPASVDDAFTIVERESPTVRQAQYAEMAARAQIQLAKAQERASVTVMGSYGETTLQSPFDHHDYDHAASVSLNVTQPIFSGGALVSQVRQASQQAAAARLQIEVVRRSAIMNVSQAWSQQRAARQNLVVDEAQTRVAQAAYEGMREEYRAGLRTTLDVLIAQQTLRDAQVSVEQARHDAYLEDAAVLNAIGRLEAGVIVQGLELYEPDESFQRHAKAGDTAWSLIPEALDTAAGPSLPGPEPLERTPLHAATVRLTPVESGDVSRIAAHQDNTTGGSQ